MLDNSFVFYLYTFIFFIFGSVIGSFLNVVILRLHEGKPVTGRSHCPHCQHQLKTADLIPIFSYILLRGKCRYCGHKLSIQYPLVELLAAVSFALFFLVWGQTLTDKGLTPVLLLSFLFSLFSISVLIVVSVYDLRWGLIPDKVILPALVISLLYQLILLPVLMYTSEVYISGVDILLDLGTVGLVGAFFFSLIFITRGKGMGGGDLKLSIFIALALGFPQAIIALLLAFLTGALASVILLSSGKKGLKSHVPFGPFLALGAYLALLWGSQLWSAYLQVLGFN